GCQAPGQPIAALCEPGTVPESAPLSPAPSPAPAAERYAPTTAVVESATRFPAASVVTARYSIRVPAGSAPTSWNTRGVSSSALSSAGNASCPAWRQLTVGSAHRTAATTALIGARPSPFPPPAGARVMLWPSPAAATGASATSTTASSAGTVSSTVPSAAAVTGAWSPYSGE